VKFLATRLEGLLIAAFLATCLGLFWPPDGYFAKGLALAGESSPYHAAAFGGLTILLAVGCLARLPQIPPLLLAGWPVLVLAAFSMLSAFWSDAPFLTVRRSATLAETAVFGIYLLARYDVPQIVAVLSKLCLIGALASLVMIAAFPDLAYAHNYTHIDSWRGAFPDKNTLGAVATVGIIVSAYAFRHGYVWRPLAALGVAANLATLYLADSKTPEVALVAACYVAALCSMRRRRDGIGLTVAFAMTVIGLAGIAIIALAPDDVMTVLNRSPTLSSRTKIWELALIFVDRYPWLGYGYGAFFRIGGVEVGQMQAIMQWPVPSTHNAWLEQALGLGWVGVGLIGFVCLIAFHRLARATTLPQQSHAPLLGALLAALLMETLTESSFLTPGDSIWVLFVVCVTALGRELSAYRGNAARGRAPGTLSVLIGTPAPTLAFPNGSRG